MKTINKILVDYLEQTASVVLLVLDKGGVITHANAFAVKMAGRDLISSHVNDFFTGFNAGLDMAALMDGSLSRSMLNINTDDNMPETFYFSSFQTDEGIALIGEFDHGEVKNLRASMLGMNNELNNMTRELLKKNAQLEQLDKLKNEFLGMAAHDLRNPIASIYSLSDFVIESEDLNGSEDLRKIIETIKQSSEFMLNLLNELLDVVKIESGKLELNLQLTDIEKLLRKNLELNSLMAAKKDIRLVLNIPQKMPDIHLDAMKIEQVLNNLLSNAIKYSHRNTTVNVNAFSTGKCVMVCVQDQGQGIPKNELDKVFTAFSNISVRGTAGEKSTGLGLNIVKRIITGHQGRLWVESEVGKGTSFHFTLPFSDDKTTNQHS